MAIIYQGTFSDGADKALVLANEEWGRGLAIGSGWTRIRLGLLVAMEPDGVNNLAGAQLRFGMATTASDHFGSQAARLWYGGLLNGNSSSNGYAGGAFTYTANANDSFYAIMNLMRVRAVDGVLSSESNSGSYYLPTLNNNKRRTVLTCGFKKSGTNLLVSPRGMTSTGGAAIDFTLANLLATMEDATDETAGSTLYCKGVTFSGATSTFTTYPTHAATYGEVVAAHVGWNKTVAKLHVHAVVVSRFA